MFCLVKQFLGCNRGAVSVTGPFCWLQQGSSLMAAGLFAQGPWYACAECRAHLCFYAGCPMYHMHIACNHTHSHSMSFGDTLLMLECMIKMSIASQHGKVLCRHVQHNAVQ